MKRFCCRNDIIPIRTVLFNAVFSRHFDHSFICFRSAVLEEYLIHSCCGADLLRKKSLRNSIWIIERLHDLPCLFPDCLYNRLITVADRIHRNSCIKIKIRLALLIPDVHILRSFSHKIKSFISLNHVFVHFILDILRG